MPQRYTVHLIRGLAAQDLGRVADEVASATGLNRDLLERSLARGAGRNLIRPSPVAVANKLVQVLAEAGASAKLVPVEVAERPPEPGERPAATPPTPPPAPPETAPDTPLTPVTVPEESEPVPEPVPEPEPVTPVTVPEAAPGAVHEAVPEESSEIPAEADTAESHPPVDENEVYAGREPERIDEGAGAAATGVAASRAGAVVGLLGAALLVVGQVAPLVRAPDDLVITFLNSGDTNAWIVLGFAALAAVLVLMRNTRLLWLPGLGSLVLLGASLWTLMADLRNVLRVRAPGEADVAPPLTDLLSGDTRLDWGWLVLLVGGVLLVLASLLPADRKRA